MTDTRDLNPDDLPLYAMHLLSGDESRTVQGRLERDAEYRREFAATQNDLVLLSLTVDQQTPSAPARERFLQQVAREKRVIPIDRGTPAAGSANAVAPGFGAPTFGTTDDERASAPASRRSSGKVLPWLGWAIAAGALFSAGSLYQERAQLQRTIAGQAAQLSIQTTQVATLSDDAARARTLLDALSSTNAMRVTLTTTPTAKPLPQGRATYIASKGTLVFLANNLDPLPAGKVYELWVIPADGSSTIPAGTFRPDARGNASLVMPELPAGVPAKAFGVTMEPEGGSAKPTLPIILAGE